MESPSLPLMKCPICDTRKPRRYCPRQWRNSVQFGCGNEREVSISCPLDCPYLMEARRHEKPHELNPDEVPNRDVQVTEEFLREHESLLVFLGSRLLEASLAQAGAVDSDVREALESLIRTSHARKRIVLRNAAHQSDRRRPSSADAGCHRGAAQGACREECDAAARRRNPRHAGVPGAWSYTKITDASRGRAFIDYLRAYFLQTEQTSRHPLRYRYDRVHRFRPCPRVESANRRARCRVQNGGLSIGIWSACGREAAFLELGAPDLTAATGLAIARGATRIVVIPYFLTLGTHLQRDLPRLAREASDAHGGIEMQITLPC